MRVLLLAFKGKIQFNSNPLISIEVSRKLYVRFSIKFLIFHGFFKLYRLFSIRIEIGFAKLFDNDEPSYRTEQQLPAKLLRTWGIPSCNVTRIRGNGIKLKEIVRDRLYASIPIKLQFPYERARGESEPIKIRSKRDERAASKRGGAEYKKNKKWTARVATMVGIVAAVPAGIRYSGDWQILLTDNSKHRLAGISRETAKGNPGVRKERE